MQGGGLDGRVPVFVFPTTLTFYLNDPSTHKQIVTVYNPYEFRISYQVLCNAPGRYRVECPQGVIRPHCCIDIVITHSDATLNNVLAPDKLRFQICEDGSRQILGRKDVLATLVQGVPDPKSAGDSDRFESVQAPEHGAVVVAGDGYRGRNQRPVFGASQGKNGPSVVLVAAAIVCVLALLLPTEGDQSDSRIPTCIHPSANVKIAISFALGMITLAILKRG
ncbi:motile sperm domain-containing protein 1-like isoform X2 [Palaemon carinicauda]